MGKIGRPTKKEQATIDKRDQDILEMETKGYPRDYIQNYYGLTKGQVSKIIKKMKQKNAVQHENQS
jgi:DNA invertase Pin-like site-specific DNA recombinase